MKQLDEAIVLFTPLSLPQTNGVNTLDWPSRYLHSLRIRAVETQGLSLRLLLRWLLNSSSRLLDKHPSHAGKGLDLLAPNKIWPTYPFSYP